MQMDLSFFDQSAALAASSAAAPAASMPGSVASVAGTNFFAAAVAVGIARAATFFALAVPAVTFAAAASQEPVFTNGAFHWQYSVAESGANYQLDLSAEPDGSEVFWEMRVTSSTHVPALDNFLWFAGESNLAGDAGVWHLFDAAAPGTSHELLSVAWTHESATDRSLTLTNVNAASPDYNDVLEFTVNGNVMQVQFTDASASTEATVQWNPVTKLGFIQAPNVNGGVRACWDATLANTICP
jgi:hypothetical protein